MSGTKFVYVTYIRAPMQKIFDAMVKPEMLHHYWAADCQERTTWEVGSPWAIHGPDGEKLDEGKVLEFDPPRKYAVSWRHLKDVEMNAEGFTRFSIELEQQGSVVKLTLTHESAAENSALIAVVSQGYQRLMAAMKTWLETGEPIAEFMKSPEGV